MIVVAWVVTVFLWIVTASFIISGCLLFLATIRSLKDPGELFIMAVVILIFALFASGGAYAALSVGRCL